MEQVRKRFVNWFKTVPAKVTIVLLAVLIFLFLLECVCYDYPAIHPYNYHINEDHTGMLFFVVWPVAYVLLELGLFVHILADDKPQSRGLLSFYRGVMFVHFLVTAVLQIVDTGGRYYKMAYVYLACYVLCSVLSIAIVLLLFIEK